MAVNEANDAVSEARRHHLYEYARASWDEEAAETLIESIPHPAADLATRRDVADLRAELGGEIKDLRAELGGEIKELRAEMGDRIGELRSEMHGLTWRLITAVALIVGIAETLGRFG